MGLASALFGFFGVDREETWKVGDQEYPSPVALFGLLAMLVGLFVFLTGLLGVCAAKYKKCCFTMPFMIFSIIMCVVMLIVAIIGIVGSSADVNLREAMCEGKQGDQQINGYPNLKAYMTDVYGGTVNKYMCSPVCPCDDAHKAVWTALTSA